MKNGDLRGVGLQGGADGIGGPSDGVQAAMSTGNVSDQPSSTIDSNEVASNHEGGIAIAPTGRSRAVNAKEVPALDQSYVSDKIKIEYFETIFGLTYEDLANDILVKVGQIGTKMKDQIFIDYRNINTPGSIVDPALEFTTRFEHTIPTPGRDRSITARNKAPRMKSLSSSDNIVLSPLVGAKSTYGTKPHITARSGDVIPTSGRENSPSVAANVTRKENVANHDEIVPSTLTVARSGAMSKSEIKAGFEHGTPTLGSALSAVTSSQAVKEETSAGITNDTPLLHAMVKSNSKTTKGVPADTGKNAASSVPAKLPKPDPRPKTNPRVQKMQGSKRRKSTPAPVDHLRRKPKYRTPCHAEEFSDNGTCNRERCELLHNCQREYFYSQDYIDAGRPWEIDEPRITDLNMLGFHPYPQRLFTQAQKGALWSFGKLRWMVRGVFVQEHVGGERQNGHEQVLPITRMMSWESKACAEFAPLTEFAFQQFYDYSHAEMAGAS